MSPSNFQILYKKRDAVFSCWNAESVYLVPLMQNQEGIDDFVIRKQNLPQVETDLDSWLNLQKNYQNMNLKPSSKTIICGVIGKYFANNDSYKSIYEALNVASIKNERKVEIINIDAESYDNSDLKKCKNFFII